MLTAKKLFGDYLKTKGLRSTLDRYLVLEGARSIDRHFDAEDLYERLRAAGSHVSRASVYRTLPLLIECGLVKESPRRQGRVSYEYLFGHDHHDHMICVRCGRVIEFRDEGIERFQEAVCEKYEFTSKDHELRIMGYCKECR
jgi:Fur family transcriptional regulator, ferric uptake regulator